jgi:hypothetical protein
MTAAIMKFSALIILLLWTAVSADATFYLCRGMDSSGQGLGYPVTSCPLYFPAFACGNNTTPVYSVLLRATIFRPQFEAAEYRDSSAKNSSAQNCTAQNASVYSHPLLPLWSQYTFFLPLSGIHDWFFGSDDGSTSSARNFLRDSGTESAADYDTPTVRMFALQDSYHEGVEQHDDQTRMGMNRFLDSDEPPGSPLL